MRKPKRNNVPEKTTAACMDATETIGTDMAADDTGIASQEEDTNVVEIKKQYRKQELSPSDKFWLLRIIFTNWLDKLTPSEYMVLMFIWQRTILWGKLSEFIKYRHFLNGIPGEISRLPLKERRLQQILKSLEKKGAIKRQSRMYGSWYSIDFDWNPTKTARRRVPRKSQNDGSHKNTKQV